MVFGLVCTFVGLLLAQVTQAASEVRHTVSFPKDKQQVFLVRSEFPVTMPVTELTMPNWTPGSYLIRDFPANVNRISATSADGTALPLQKISKDRWQVNTAQTDILIVDYAVSTPMLNVSTSWASREFSLINGASVFLYTPQTADIPQRLKIISEPIRGGAFSSMRAVAGEGGYRAENYDELVDNHEGMGSGLVVLLGEAVGSKEFVLHR